MYTFNHNIFLWCSYYSALFIIGSIKVALISLLLTRARSRRGRTAPNILSNCMPPLLTSYSRNNASEVAECTVMVTHISLSYMCVLSCKVMGC